MEEEDYGTYCFLMESRGVEFLSLTLIPSPPTCPPPPQQAIFTRRLKVKDRGRKGARRDRMREMKKITEKKREGYKQKGG